MRSTVLAGVALGCIAPAAANNEVTEQNPIRKVVNLLQQMQKKVTAEGEKEKDLYEKFMCYCKTGGSDLSASLSAAENKIPAVTSDIKASEERLTQTKSDLAQAQVDRTAAKKAVAEATALREKEAATYAAAKAEYDTNIAAINKAVTALEKGMAGGFLQTQSADILKKLVNKQDMLDADRQELVAFLSGTQGNGYAPSSGEVTGILKQLGDEMVKTLTELTSDEKTAITNFEDLSKAKAKEIGALTASIESKTLAVGELGIQIVQMKDDLSDTQAALEQDQAFMADLKKSCSTKTGEWEERQKTRAEELVALADTIQLLNQDDALDLFKKTLPSASSAFLQMSSSSSRVQAQALNILRQAHQAAGPHERSGLDFLMLALQGKQGSAKGGFGKVIKMIDNMVSILKQEQVDDDNKKEYCQVQLDQTDDKKKATQRLLQEHSNGMDTTAEAIATLRDEIKALTAGIKALDKSVAEATEQRKAENVEFKELMASDTSAKEILGFAKNRLNKFYNPKMYKAPPKVELSEGDRISSNFGGAVFAQVSIHRQLKDAPAPPPSTWGAYSKKSGETNGVMAMIDLLIKDLDKEMTEASVEEKNSQADYGTMMSESAAKRVSDSKSLSGKVSTLADTESELESLKESHKAAGREIMAVSKYIASLHAECDWLMQYHDVRKEARAGEVESLTKAKAVLSGADFSMVQTKARGFLRGQ